MSEETKETAEPTLEQPFPWVAVPFDPDHYGAVPVDTANEGGT